MGNESARSYLAGKPFYGGLDLAAGIDINAFCMIFPNVATLTKDVWLQKMDATGLKLQPPDIWKDLPIHACIWRFWIPESKVKEKADRFDYRRCADDGYVTICEGRSVDHAQVINDIYNDSIAFKTLEINYDARLAEVSNVVKSLRDRGVEMVGFGQGIMSVSEPTKELERLINNFQFEHFNNPVMNWMMSNAVKKTDPVGNIRLDKEKSMEKIDGVAAMVNAVAGAMAKGWNVEGNDDAILTSW